jgi:short-subunit dehydrogenase
MTTTDLRGRTALVTGGSRGIGAAIVRAWQEPAPQLPSIIASAPVRRMRW